MIFEAILRALCDDILRTLRALTERIDGLEDRVVKLEGDHGRLMAKTAGLGGVAGGAMTALVEVVRYFATKG
ncbi:hypothetical protein [Burkholderia pseudomallei]|uniref:hypothetical protein n=1 Tax=Burkholderia pseudomallei TaxID=28450 RepID=UPI001F510CCA|nr:hypothetical protein [Burkholderia pseudomallei]NRE51530.1 hypothetical protein [Burkholderia pseudomallei]